MEKKKEKRKAILLLAYSAGVSCLTNRSFYMRTLSLSHALSYCKESSPMSNETKNLITIPDTIPASTTKKYTDLIPDFS